MFNYVVETLCLAKSLAASSINNASLKALALLINSAYTNASRSSLVYIKHKQFFRSKYQLSPVPMKPHWKLLTFELLTSIEIHQGSHSALLICYPLPHRALPHRALLHTHHPCRGPPPRGHAYAWLTNSDESITRETVHHRILPVNSGTGTEFLQQEKTESGLSTSSQLRAGINARIKASALTQNDLVLQRSCKRGWRAQGYLAGQWRDHLGRQRRAWPSKRITAASASVGGTSVESVPRSLSCAGTEVSFEGLVEELRERVLGASHLVDPITMKHVGSTCSLAEALALGYSERGKGRKTLGEIRPGEYPQRNTANAGSLGGGDKEKGGSLGMRCCRTEQLVLPSGCLWARQENGGFRAAHPQPTSSGLGGKSRSALGPQSSLLQLEGGAFPGQNFYGLTTTTISGGFDNSSPSAAMVAAAKAHERALPLLQVCAVKVMEPAGT